MYSVAVVTLSLLLHVIRVCTSVLVGKFIGKACIIQGRKSKTVLMYYFFTSCSKEFCLSPYFEKKLHLFWIKAKIYMLRSGR